MNTFLWILQGLVAAVFAMAGLMKATQPKEKLAASQPWAEDVSPSAIKSIGIVELLGAVGLILPAALGSATFLTPLAATGLAVVMIFAAGAHARRKEYGNIVVNVVLLAMTAVVAWGRFGPYDF
ncbi:DoxX family protein [Streptomyces sp. NPDC001970]